MYTHHIHMHLWDGCVCIDTCTHTRIHTHIYTCKHRDTYTHMHSRTHTSIPSPCVEGTNLSQLRNVVAVTAGRSPCLTQSQSVCGEQLPGLRALLSPKAWFPSAFGGSRTGTRGVHRPLGPCAGSAVSQRSLHGTGFRCRPSPGHTPAWWAPCVLESHQHPRVCSWSPLHLLLGAEAMYELRTWGS